MASPYLISASILSADLSRLGEQIHEAETAGVDWIHVDVMDGHFVPNLTMGPVIVEACRRVTNLPLDVHLMVESPDHLLPAFARSGASNLSVHVETCPDLAGTIQAIHELGCKAGVVLNPATPAESVIPFLPLVDLVLVLTVNPGYSGQEFMPEVLPKLTTLRDQIRSKDLPVWLEVDGGINHENISQVRRSGADVFVSASAIFKDPQGIAAGIRSLRSKLTD